MSSHRLPSGNVDLDPRAMRILRENTPSPIHVHPNASDKVNPRVIPGGAVINEKTEDMALPINHTLFTKPGPYVPGDGDVMVPRRPGSDHSHIKSRGYRC